MTHLVIMQRIKSLLKLRIKQKGKSYKDLAVHLKTSESALKRIMTKDEISLDRLISICDFLDLRMSDLFTSAETITKLKPLLFTADQEDFLTELDLRYAVFVSVEPGKSAAQIGQKLDVDERSVLETLWELEKLKLVKQSTDGKSYCMGKYGTVRAHGPVYRKYVGRTSKLVQESLFKKTMTWPPDADPSEIVEKEKVILAATISMVQKNTWSTFHKRFLELIRAFHETASMESRLYPEEDLISVAASLMMDHSPTQSEHVAALFFDPKLRS